MKTMRDLLLRFSSSKQNRARGVLWLAAVLAAILHFQLCARLTAEIALDMDTVNFAYALESFDIAQLSPHPPGYLPYVLLLRSLSVVTSAPPIDVVQLASRLFSCATILILPLILTRLCRNRNTEAVFAVVLGAFHPFFIFHGVDGQTHASEGFVAALLFWALLHPCKDKKRGLAAGLLTALGIALRPSFLLISAGPVIWTFRKHRGILLLIAGIIVFCSALWLVPTIYLTGGLEKWLSAHRAFIVDGFIDPASRIGVSAERVAIWSALLIAPFAPLILRLKQSPAALKALTLSAAVPSVLFYLVTFISEPGYLQGLVPLAIVCTVVLAGQSKKPVLFGAIALAVQIGILLLPEGGRANIKNPSIPEIINRQIAGKAVLKQIIQPLQPADSVLYLTDYPGAPLQRQLPKLRPSTHVLWLYRNQKGSAKVTSMSHSTNRTMTPIPGPVMFSVGPPSSFDTHASYRFIVLDPLLSPAARRALKPQCRCPITVEPSEPRAVHLQAACFPQGSLSFGGHTVLFTPLEH